jgi:hypothetical protein
MLRVSATVLMGFLASQILLGYLKHGGANNVADGDNNQLNIIRNSYIQINTKDNNMYIKSDAIELLENKITLRNNFINSNILFGTSDLMTYDKATGDVSMENRPKFTIVEF